MEEQLRIQEEKWAKQQIRHKLSQESMNKMMQTFAEMNERLKAAEDKRSSEGKTSSSSSSSSSKFSENEHGFRIQRYNPKLEFPKFKGMNRRMWIKKCDKYFSLRKVHEDQKVDLACLNMIDKAENWMSSYLAVRRNVD